MSEKSIQKCKVVHPQQIYLNICRIANLITVYDEFYSEEVCCITIPKYNAGITVYMVSECGESNPRITRYDLAVMDALYTLCVNNCTIFTPEQVVRTMCGDPGKSVTSQMTEAVSSSITKLSNITINMDVTEEFRVRKKITKEQTMTFCGHLISVSSTNALSANHKAIKVGYILEEKPILYQYAEEVGQIISAPAKLICAGHTRDTSEEIVIKHYLIRRIHSMKNGKNKMHARKISYQWYDNRKAQYRGLLPTLGYSEADYKNWRDKRSKIHRYVCQTLDTFVAANYIQGYQVLRDNPYHGISGVEIRL